VRASRISNLLRRPRSSEDSFDRLAWPAWLLLVIVLAPLLIWAVHVWRTERGLTDSRASSVKIAAEPVAGISSPCNEYGAAIPPASTLLADMQRAAPALGLEAQFNPSLRNTAAADELDVTLALKAPYAVIKAVASEVLERHPASALLTLDIRREWQQGEELDARLAFVFWVAADGTRAARCEGRKQPS
jgi:hypothetical protein